MKALQNRTGLDFTLWKRRGTVLRLDQIPGGTDSFKENRGEQILWRSLLWEPDFRRRHGHMSTSNTEEGYRTKEEKLGSVELAGGWQWRLLKECLLAKAMLFVIMWSLWYMFASAWKHWVIAGSPPPRLWGWAWEKSCGGDQTWDVPHAQWLSG